MEDDGVVIVAYASGIGGVTVRDGCVAAAVQLLPLLDVVVAIDGACGGGFFIFMDVLAFDLLFVTRDGKSSSVTTPADLRCNEAALDPSAVQPMVNRFAVFELGLLVESSFVVTVSCNDGNADAVILESSKCPWSLLLLLL